jgi:hypothetical protein
MWPKTGFSTKPNYFYNYNSDDYFKCAKHTGLRPVTHHTTPSRRIGWLYTYPTNWNMGYHFSICQWCPPSLVDRKQFSAIRPHTSTTYWFTGWESNPWPETHHLGPGPLDQGQITFTTRFYPIQNGLLFIALWRLPDDCLCKAASYSADVNRRR